MRDRSDKAPVPRFGAVCEEMGIARFTRTLGTLDFQRRAHFAGPEYRSRNHRQRHYCRAIGQVHDSVKEGETDRAALESFESISADGSQHDRCRRTIPANFPTCFSRWPIFTTKKWTIALEALTCLLEPVMIRDSGCFVGTIVLGNVLAIAVDHQPRFLNSIATRSDYGGRG